MRECPYYSERERAALAWTEAVTLITDGHVPDRVYDEVRGRFTEKELAFLAAEEDESVEEKLYVTRDTR